MVNRSSGKINTSTKYRMVLLTKFIDENNRIPSLEEAMKLLGLNNKNTAREYLKRISNALPDPSSDLSGIQEKLLVNIRRRLGDEEHPMNDSDMIKLLEFMFPKKSDIHQTVEKVKVIEDDDYAELEQYAKIFGGTEEPTTEAL